MDPSNLSFHLPRQILIYKIWNVEFIYKYNPIASFVRYEIWNK